MSKKPHRYRKSYPQILKEALDVHQGRYSYGGDGDWYVNNKSKWEIYCSKHGVFYQSVIKHLKGQGCPKCRICSNTGEPKIRDLNGVRSYLQQGLTIKDQPYYGVRSTLTLTCDKHGDFKVKARKIIEGTGCKACSIDKLKKSSDDYVKEFLKIHGDLYDYSYFKSSGANINSLVKCKSHGIFKVTPNKHKNGRGCPQCTKLTSSWYNSTIIERYKNKFLQQQGFLYILKISEGVAKVGISRDVNQRVRKITKELGERVTPVLTLKTSLYDAYYLEQKVLSVVNRGHSEVKFAGWTESFPLNEVDIALKALFEGKGTSGTGSSQQGGIGSTVNANNKALNLIKDKDGVLWDMDTSEIWTGEENE